METLPAMTVNRAAPVALFAYKRLHHLQRTVESLLRNAEAKVTEVHVYCDGPKTERDRDAVEGVRQYVATITGFAAVHTTFRDRNLGLAQSIINGVSEVLGQYGRIIVLEDDLVLSPFFLRYMNQALECYAEDEEVASIHGYCYPSDIPLPDTFFIRGADCWGWATWSRGWAHFEPDGRRLLEDLRSRHLSDAFDFDRSFPYTRMLEDQVGGCNDSWAIRWYASCFLKGMFTLYPGHSLVENIGTDASGTHCTETTRFSQDLATSAVQLARIPIAESAPARRAFVQFFRGPQQPSIATRLGRVLKKLYQSPA
jgi:hypothetical protein